MAKSKKTVGVVLVISFTTLQKKKFNMLLGLKKMHQIFTYVRFIFAYISTTIFSWKCHDQINEKFLIGVRKLSFDLKHLYEIGEKVTAAERALATFFSSFPLFSHLGDAFSCLSIFEP